ncbi:hypothetical protein HYC85_025748 [Camellia sinensis]|uniref:Uncharacterized protein n=1 Tax=Camellia sinensis TaxID=4442 RepID=A0A7J7GC08_CAMSI|nr:hypothetical protein HYC85_025748 [Camellia sinensis]
MCFYNFRRIHRLPRLYFPVKINALVPYKFLEGAKKLKSICISIVHNKAIACLIVFAST